MATEDSGELETRKPAVHADMSVEDVSAFLREQVKLPDRFCEAFEGIALTISRTHPGPFPTICFCSPCLVNFTTQTMMKQKRY